MFTSLSVTAAVVDEAPARSSLPWVWFGFLFVAAFLIEETLMIFLELDESSATLVLVVIGLAGWIYWLFCVHRFHTILGEISHHQYPITSGEAAWKHIIPFYNLFWIFRWPTAMSDYVNRYERVKMVSGGVIGAVLLIFLLVGRFFDGAIGLAGVFTMGMYISSKLRKHIAAISVSRDKLPPLPDPSLFAGASETRTGPETERLPKSSHPGADTVSAHPTLQ